MIALGSFEEEFRPLYAFDLEDTGPTIGWQPAWSPDGHRIAAITSPRQGEFWVVVVSVADRKLLSKHRLPEGILKLPNHLSPPNQFRWSPDGQKLLVSWEAVAVVDTESGSVQRLSEGPVVAEWAPDSSGVYYLEIANWDSPGKRAFGGFYFRKLGAEEAVEVMGAKQLVAAGLRWPLGLHYGIMSLSPSATRLALVVGPTGDAAGTLLVYEPKPGEMLALERPARRYDTDGRIATLQWSPAEERLAVIMVGLTGSEGVQIQVLDLSSGEWKTVATVPLKLTVAGIEVLAFKNLSWTR